jgi:hypothetical protein
VGKSTVWDCFEGLEGHLEIDSIKITKTSTFIKHSILIDEEAFVI